jgi:hypothetical protein
MGRWRVARRQAVLWAAGLFGEWTLGRVALSIRRDGDNALIRWPVTSTSDQIEETDNFPASGTVWRQFDRPVSANNGYYEATVPLSGPSRFLRLRREWQ